MQVSMFVTRKRDGQQEKLNAIPAGNLIYLQDDLTSRRFLVDSGASVSIFPHHGPPPKFPKLRLQKADGFHVSCNGERLIPLKFGSTSYEWSFQLAPVTGTILGANFLRHFCLLVHMVGQRVLDASTLLTVGSNAASLLESNTLYATLLSTPEPICQLLAEYPDVLSMDSFFAASQSHGIFHHIKTTPGSQFLPKLIVWILASWQLPRPRWRLLGLFAAQIPHGPVLYTWFLRKTVLGDPVEITGASTTKPFQIGIPCQILQILVPHSMVPQFSPSLTCRRVITRFP